MVKKPKLTRKDSYILILGVFLGFMVQIAYDIAHEFASVLSHESINWNWVILQSSLAVIDFVIVVLILRQIEQE
jgi:hypothetical protein